ncbi:MAG: carbohydrate kinase family protein [Bacillota bacterium]
MKEFDVVCVGVAVVDLPLYPVDKELFSRNLTQIRPPEFHAGGGAANQAIVLSRMGNRTSLLTILGKDVFGQILTGLLSDCGKDIDLSHVSFHEKARTGISVVMIEPDGQRHFCVNRGANNHFSIERLDLSVLKRAKVVSLSYLFALPGFDGTGTTALLKIAKENGAITVVDTLTDIAGIGLDGVRSTLECTDYFFPSYDEAAAISRETEPERIADVFLNAGAGHVGIKLGSKGCYFKDKDNEFYLPAFDGPVVDTTGAGDNFMSGFITGLVRGWDIRRCCRLGNAAGALCVAEIGANSAIKDFEQVENFLKEREKSYENCSY